jgi:hypothetical protein
MTHISEEDLVLLYYDEPGVRPELHPHLRECAECTAAARQLARDLNRCNDWLVPEPDPELARGVWARIAPHLEEPRVARFGWLKMACAVAIMATLVFAAFVAGRASRQPRPTLMTGLSTEARERILAISLADHLDRAEMLLTGISNSDGLDAAEVADDRGRAQDLVEEGRIMRQTLARAGDTSTVALLDEVERFMLEIANSPGTLTPVEVRQLRERIGAGSLLFKVRITESNLRSEGQKL